MSFLKPLGSKIDGDNFTKKIHKNSTTTSDQTLADPDYTNEGDVAEYYNPASGLIIQHENTIDVFNELNENLVNSSTLNQDGSLTIDYNKANLFSPKDLITKNIDQLSKQPTLSDEESETLTKLKLLNRTATTANDKQHFVMYMPDAIQRKLDDSDANVRHEGRKEAVLFKKVYEDFHKDSNPTFTGVNGETLSKSITLQNGKETFGAFETLVYSFHVQPGAKDHFQAVIGCQPVDNNGYANRKVRWNNTDDTNGYLRTLKNYLANSPKLSQEVRDSIEKMPFLASAFSATASNTIPAPVAPISATNTTAPNATAPNTNTPVANNTIPATGTSTPAQPTNATQAGVNAVSAVLQNTGQAQVTQTLTDKGLQAPDEGSARENIKKSISALESAGIDTSYFNNLSGNILSQLGKLEKAYNQVLETSLLPIVQASNSLNTNLELLVKTASLTHSIDNLNDVVKNKESEISKLNEEKSEFIEKVTSLSSELSSTVEDKNKLQTEIESLESDYSSLEKHSEILEKHNSKRKNILSTLKQNNSKLEKEIVSLKDKIVEIDLENQQEIENINSAHAKDLEIKLNNQKTELNEAKDIEIDEITKVLNKAHEEEKATAIADLKKKLEEQYKADLKKAVDEAVSTNTNTLKESFKTEKEEIIENHKQAIANKDSLIKDAQALVNSKESIISSKNTEIDNLKNEFTSLQTKATSNLQIMKDIIKHYDPEFDLSKMNTYLDELEKKNQNKPKQ
ncbi:TPA: hypothetical protein ACGR6T_004747 [Klebsiella aerogenes]